MSIVIYDPNHKVISCDSLVLGDYGRIRNEKKLFTNGTVCVSGVGDYDYIRYIADNMTTFEQAAWREHRNGAYPKRLDSTVLVVNPKGADYIIDKTGIPSIITSKEPIVIGHYRPVGLAHFMIRKWKLGTTQEACATIIHKLMLDLIKEDTHYADRAIDGPPMTMMWNKNSSSWSKVS